MSKIYLVQSHYNSLGIIEVELKKQTPEQLRVDPDTAKIVWQSGSGISHTYISSRLQRHRQTYFSELKPAIDAAIAIAKNNLEKVAISRGIFEAQIANLIVFAEEQEKADAS